MTYLPNANDVQKAPVLSERPFAVPCFRTNVLGSLMCASKHYDGPIMRTMDWLHVCGELPIYSWHYFSLTPNRGTRLKPLLSCLQES